MTVECFGVLASRRAAGPRTVRGRHGRRRRPRGRPRRCDRHVLAAVNGDQTSRDAELPLLAGDTVAFLSADAGG